MLSDINIDYKVNDYSNSLLFNLNQESMENKTIKLNSGKIISIRKQLDKKITEYWHIIRVENVMSKKAIAAGQGSGLDLKALYNTITQLQECRIKIKGMLVCLNSGESSFDYDKFKKTNNYNIFAACEAKEAIAQLKMIHTLDPKIKAKKGLKNIGSVETFSSAKIAQLIKDLQLVANKYDAKLANFNNNTEIDITSYSDSVKEFLAI